MYGDGELENAGDTFRELRKQVESRHGPVSDEALAKQLSLSAGALRSYTHGRTMPKPTVLRALAELAGVQVSRVYAEMGWLPGHEVSDVQQPDLLTQLETTTAAMAKLSERLDSLPSEDVGRATLLAAAAVLGDEQAATRFRIRLQALSTGERCPMATTLLAEFTPCSTVQPLDERELAARTLAVGLHPARGAKRDADGSDADSTRHRRFQMELEVVTAEALSKAGDFSWQGEPGTTLWKPVSQQWPTHLLVQHLTGHPFNERRPWASTDGLPILVIGADYSIGATAALLAGALGWRYVPVTSATALDSGRLVRSQSLAPVIRRRQGWSAAARQTGRLTDPADPWPAVMSVRPYVFGDRDVRDEATCLLLRDIRAHVVYARPSPVHIDWWARRRQLTALDTRAADVWKADAYGALAHVEEVLEERKAAWGPHQDLRLRLNPLFPAPDTEDPCFPAQLTDSQFDCGARCLSWLDQVANKGRASLLHQIRPSRLRTHLPRADTSDSVVSPW